jgi:glycosyltransferase involved in cell wall biosynthesis
MIMSDKPLVSIIMNCYNSDRYLVEAIDSVFAQTYQNWEIIFWDNQSTDESAKIVKSYDDERVKYFYAPKHTPLGNARNLAIEKANGEWVAILDCDDIWHKDKLQDAFNLLDGYKDRDDVTLLYSKTKYIDENGETFGLFEEHYSGDIHDLLLKRGDFVFISSAIFRTDTLKKVGKIDTTLHYAEDYDVLLKVTKNHKALCVDKFHTYYRVHGNSLTTTKIYEYDVENFEFLGRYIKENNPPNDIRFAIFLKNSERLTASLFKLGAKRDFKSIVKILKGYWQYALLSPYYVIYFIVKRIKKKINESF